MSTSTQIIPHLTCRGGHAALDFYAKAFGAEKLCAIDMPDGRLLHGAISIDQCLIYLHDEILEHGGLSPQTLNGTPVKIHLQVADCDAVYNRAVEAGCVPVMPLEDMFWGDRYGMVKDPFGHQWSIATAKRTPSPEELRSAVAAMA